MLETRHVPTMTPLDAYTRRVRAGELDRDDAQTQAMRHFERLYDDLVASGPPVRGWRRRIGAALGRRRPPVKGLYLFGGVGRGKTMMMDLFHAALPFDDKLRLHFHRFVAEVHAELKRLHEQPDPLQVVAERFAQRARVICFDEFAVNDIADAMILGTLFDALFARGVTLAATSNLAPEALYRDGLQRQRFVPTIDLIRRHTDVVEIDSGRDYRLEFLERSNVYLCPDDAAADRALEGYFRSFAPDGEAERGTIEVLGRPIQFRRMSDGIVWFDFAAVCEGPRSQDDYIELSMLYHTVLVSNVPQFDTSTENAARRFIALVDEFYDRRVKLILSAAEPIGTLYRGERLQHEFERTRSRLTEMQSHDYLAAAHRT